MELSWFILCSFNNVIIKLYNCLFPKYHKINTLPLNRDYLSYVHLAFMVEIISDEKSRYSHAELLVSPLHAHGPAVSLTQDALQYPPEVHTSTVVLVNHVRDDGVHKAPHHVVVHCSEIEKETFGNSWNLFTD